MGLFLLILFSTGLLTLNFIHALPIRISLSALVCLAAIIYQTRLNRKGKKVKQNYNDFVPLSADQGEDKSLFEQNSDVDPQETDLAQVINQLIFALKGKTPVLPILSEQLHSVIQLTDDAAMQIIMSFRKISKQARKLLFDMQSVFNLFPDDEEVEEDSVLVHIKNTLSFLKEELNLIRTDFIRNQESANHVYNEINNTQEIIDRTNKITEHMKVLSINASVVSARAGSGGKVFSVIAREFQKLAVESEESNKDIENIIKSIIELAGETSIHSEELLNKIDKTFESVVFKFTDIISKVDWLINEFRDKLHTLTKDTEILSAEIKKIIMSIQFQDISRQRIEHVINPIDEMYSDLETLVKNFELTSDSHTEITKDDLEKLENSYTMADEKILLQNVLKKTMEEIS